MQEQVGYKKAAPSPLARADTSDGKARAAGLSPNAVLRADLACGSITLASAATLRGISLQAWTCKRGNRWKLDQVRDQYQGKTQGPHHPREVGPLPLRGLQERVTGPLARVTTASAKTVKIGKAMKKAAQ